MGRERCVTAYNFGLMLVSTPQENYKRIGLSVQGRETSILVVMVRESFGGEVLSDLTLPGQAGFQEVERVEKDVQS